MLPQWELDRLNFSNNESETSHSLVLGANLPFPTFFLLGGQPPIFFCVHPDTKQNDKLMTVEAQLPLMLGRFEARQISGGT